MLPTLPEGALSTILAASIAAVASLLGLIITKEQKVSDLRQAWIDALREDLSHLIACASEMAFNPYQFSDKSEAQARNTVIVQEANLRTYRTRLRLNMTEAACQDLDAAIDNIQMLAQQTPHPDENEMEKAERDLVSKAQVVLKGEWERVKKGEPYFRVFRTILFTSLFVLIALLIIAVFSPTSSNEPTSAPSSCLWLV